MAGEMMKRPMLKGPRVIPPRLTTKSSTDLLPLEMRLGTSKDAQPAAILKKKQVQKLDIPAQPLRRKSSADIDEKKRSELQEQTVQAAGSLLYVHCQLNGDEAIAQINTGTVDSLIPRGIALAYGLIDAAGKEISHHSNKALATCPAILTDDCRINAHIRLGRAPLECHIKVVPDTSAVLLTIGMDVLHSLKCILDVSNRVLYIAGLAADSPALQLLTHEEVFGDIRLVRSQSSTL